MLGARRVPARFGKRFTLSSRSALRDHRPLRTGENLIGFLQIGEVMLKEPTRAQFSKVASLLVKWGIGDELKKAEEAWLEAKCFGANSMSLFYGCSRFSHCT